MDDYHGNILVSDFSIASRNHITKSYRRLARIAVMAMKFARLITLRVALTIERRVGTAVRRN
jgi:hypothetical protein